MRWKETWSQLTNLEICLLVSTTLAVITTITLCLCIHFIIPDTGCTDIPYGKNITNRLAPNKTRTSALYIIRVPDNTTNPGNATNHDNTTRLADAINPDNGTDIESDIVKTNKAPYGEEIPEERRTALKDVISEYDLDDYEDFNDDYDDETDTNNYNDTRKNIKVSSENSTDVLKLITHDNKENDNVSARPKKKGKHLRSKTRFGTSRSEITTGQPIRITVDESISTPIRVNNSPRRRHTTPVTVDTTAVLDSTTNSMKKSKRSIDNYLEDNSNNNCNCPKLTDESIEVDIPVTRPETFADKIYQYSYLVSISVPTWIDSISNNERIYKCAGVIINEDSVLTGKYVTQEEKDLLLVRAGSDFWSFGGTIHSVVSVTKFGSSVILKVTPDFNFNTYVKPFKISSDSSSKNENSAKLIGWAQSDGNLMKYNRFDVEIVDKSIISCGNCNADDTFDCNKYKLGNVLVSNGDTKVLF